MGRLDGQMAIITSEVKGFWGTILSPDHCLHSLSEKTSNMEGQKLWNL